MSENYLGIVFALCASVLWSITVTLIKPISAHISPFLINPIKNSIGFCLAVQWHPEWNASSDKVSKPLFQNFGENLRLPSN